MFSKVFNRRLDEDTSFCGTRPQHCMLDGSGCGLTRLFEQVHPIPRVLVTQDHPIPRVIVTQDHPIPRVIVTQDHPIPRINICS